MSCKSSIWDSQAAPQLLRPREKSVQCAIFDRPRGQGASGFCAHIRNRLAALTGFPRENSLMSSYFMDIEQFAMAKKTRTCGLRISAESVVTASELGAKKKRSRALRNGFRWTKINLHADPTRQMYLGGTKRRARPQPSDLCLDSRDYGAK